MKASKVRALQFRRFTRLNRTLHILMIVSFISLALTGMTLKFSYTNRIRSEAVSRKLADAILELHEPRQRPGPQPSPGAARPHRLAAEHVHPQAGAQQPVEETRPGEPAAHALRERQQNLPVVALAGLLLEHRGTPAREVPAVAPAGRPADPEEAAADAAPPPRGAMCPQTAAARPACDSRSRPANRGPSGGPDAPRPRDGSRARRASGRRE